MLVRQETASTENQNKFSQHALAKPTHVSDANCWALLVNADEGLQQLQFAKTSNNDVGTILLSI